MNITFDGRVEHAKVLLNGCIMPDGAKNQVVDLIGVLMDQAPIRYASFSGRDSHLAACFEENHVAADGCGFGIIEEDDAYLLTIAPEQYGVGSISPFIIKKTAGFVVETGTPPLYDMEPDRVTIRVSRKNLVGFRPFPAFVFSDPIRFSIERDDTEDGKEGSLIVEYTFREWKGIVLNTVRITEKKRWMKRGKGIVQTLAAVFPQWNVFYYDVHRAKRAVLVHNGWRSTGEGIIFPQKGGRHV